MVTPSGRCVCTNLGHDVGRVREAAEHGLLRDLGPVDPHRELTGVSDDELGIDPEILFQLGCRTGSTRPIASRVAVSNRHLHVFDHTNYRGHDNARKPAWTRAQSRHSTL